MKALPGSADSAKDPTTMPAASTAAATRPAAPVVLFLCTGNSARSQMAEAFLKKYAGDRFEVHSAGMVARGIHPLTTCVMQEVGIDISGQSSKPLRPLLGTLAVRVAITLCAPAEEDCPTLWPGALLRLSWPFENPAAADGTDEEKLLRFRAVRDSVDERIKRWLSEIDAGAKA